MNLIILGPPGSGKGTQAKLLAKEFGLKHISSGQLLRQAAEEDTPKAKKIKTLLETGELLPFETVLEVIGTELLNTEKGFILDGTPRNQAQAEYIDDFLEENETELSAVIYLSLSDRESTERLLKRASIEGRSDDTESVIKERLRVYHLETVPVIEHYRRQGKLLEIDGAPSVEAVFSDIVDSLNDKSLEQE